MSIYDIDNTVREVIGTTRRNAGLGPKKSMGMGQGMGLGKRREFTSGDVMVIVKKVMEKLPEVQSASGQITLKMSSEPMPKTLSFKYR